MRFSFFVEDVVAVSADQLMEEYESSNYTENEWRNTKSKKSKFENRQAVLQKYYHKKMFWNMQQINRRAPILKCDFHKDAKGYF